MLGMVLYMCIVFVVQKTTITPWPSSLLLVRPYVQNMQEPLSSLYELVKDQALFEEFA